MVVYIEYALIENCLLDGLLVYLALKCAKTRVYKLNLACSACLGGIEAIVFPLFPLPVWAAYFVKFLGGALVVLVAVRRGNCKTYLVVFCAFFLMTFALGGLLTALYSFFNVEYEKGNGFFIERAPVSLVFATAGVFTTFTVAFVKRFYRFRAYKRNLVPCYLRVGKVELCKTALVDSGNMLTFQSHPVSVISSLFALFLLKKGAQEVGRITVKTVNGAQNSPVICCNGMEILCEKNRLKHAVAYFTVGEVTSKEYQIILHSALIEEESYVGSIKKMATKIAGRRKRNTLSLRK